MDDKLIEGFRAVFQDMVAAFPTGEFPIGFHTTRPEVRVKRGISVCVELTRSWKKFEPDIRFEIVSQGSPRLPFTVAEWADIDQAGRAVFARGGCVYALTLGPDGSPTERLLADFNADRFEPIEAPEWATRW